MQKARYFDRARKEMDDAHLGITPLRNYMKARAHLTSYLEDFSPNQVEASPDLELAKSMLDDAQDKIEKITHRPKFPTG